MAAFAASDTLLELCDPALVHHIAAPIGDSSMCLFIVDTGKRMMLHLWDRRPCGVECVGRTAHVLEPMDSTGRRRSA